MRTKPPPASLADVSLQAVPRDQVEQRIQDLAWAEWYAANPDGSYHHAAVMRRLPPPSPAQDLEQ